MLHHPQVSGCCGKHSSLTLVFRFFQWFLSSVTAHSRQIPGGLGRVTQPSGSSGLELCKRTAGTYPVGVPARLCSGTESSRIPVVTLKATRASQLLSEDLLATKLLRSQSTSSDAQKANAGDSVLGAGRTISLECLGNRRALHFRAKAVGCFG